MRNLGQYYDNTTGVVTDHLIELLKRACGDIGKEIEAWELWINIWSRFTLESFLESNIKVIKAKVPQKYHRDIKLEILGKLLPWSNDAVRGYSVSTYTIELDVSLVVYLREQLGNWWSENMHAIVGGMEQLPIALSKSFESLKGEILFDKQVSKISYHSSFQSDNPNGDRVVVTCYGDGKQSEYKHTAKVSLVFFLPGNFAHL